MHLFSFLGIISGVKFVLISDLALFCDNHRQARHSTSLNFSEKLYKFAVHVMYMVT